MTNVGSSGGWLDDDDVEGKTMRERMPDCEPEKMASDDDAIDGSLVLSPSTTSVAVTHRTGSPSAVSCADRMYSSRRNGLSSDMMQRVGQSVPTEVK